MIIIPVDVLIFKEIMPDTNASDHMYVAVFNNNNLLIPILYHLMI